MERFKLNFHQILGLMTSGIGAIVYNFSMNPVGWLFIFFGLIIFLAATKINPGFTISFGVIVIGFMFRIMHWQWGMEIMLVGVLSMLLFSFFKFIFRKNKPDLLLVWISLLIIVAGIYLKIMHLKFNNEILLIGYIGSAISYTYRFLKKQPKYFEDYNKMLLILFWSIASIFTVYHLQWKEIFSIASMIILWTWLITSLIRELKPEKVEYERIVLISFAYYATFLKSTYLL